MLIYVCAAVYCSRGPQLRLGEYAFSYHVASSPDFYTELVVLGCPSWIKQTFRGLTFYMCNVRMSYYRTRPRKCAWAEHIYVIGFLHEYLYGAR